MKHKNKILYNGYECKILKVWDDGFYDLETIEKTKLGIIESYLSVPQESLILSKHKQEVQDWNSLMIAWDQFHRNKILPFVKSTTPEKRHKMNLLITDMKSSLKWCR